ncbi:hypothetical protein H072_7360 [Dactylellina haptotyla CBS 200.50]|uniref:Uncharacterized protein n=1 Tax=Dactylellina haptotyla (strain CBS 200.50) TaxID=1284197 RepID=S8ACR7_DACHA|nr:hypothetical protein H072_7360 [Dactylellina haptotyla CBS 200.50]
MPCVATEIKKGRRHKPYKRPYGAGHLVREHCYGAPDIFTPVKYNRYPNDTETAYYIDHISLIDNWELGADDRAKLVRRRGKEVYVAVLVEIKGTYELALQVECLEDETVDDVVHFIIETMHEVTDGDNEIPRAEGFAFDILYNERSLLGKINEVNRYLGERMLVSEVFRDPGSDGEFDLIWKEYDAHGKLFEDLTIAVDSSHGTSPIEEDSSSGSYSETPDADDAGRYPVVGHRGGIPSSNLMTDAARNSSC